VISPTLPEKFSADEPRRVLNRSCEHTLGDDSCQRNRFLWQMSPRPASGEPAGCQSYEAGWFLNRPRPCSRLSPPPDAAWGPTKWVKNAAIVAGPHQLTPGEAPPGLALPPWHHSACSGRPTSPLAVVDLVVLALRLAPTRVLDRHPGRPTVGRLGASAVRKRVITHSLAVCAYPPMRACLCQSSRPPR